MEALFLFFQEHFDTRTIIALIALLIAVHQGYASRKHNKLSVQPYLCDHLDLNSQDKTIHFKIINKGLGTAKISSFKYLWDKQVINSTTLEQKIKIMVGEDVIFTIHSMGKGHALSKDEEVSIIFIKIPSQNHEQCNAKEKYDAIQSNLLKSLRLTINYKSIYEQKFKYYTEPTSFSPTKLTL